MFIRSSTVKIFWFSAIVTVLVFIFAGKILGSGVLLTLFSLMVVEISLSADSAIVNADKLSKLSHFWQMLFLSVGILIAVFGVRFLLPVAIVSHATSLGLGQVIKLAFEDPKQYSEQLRSVYPIIASFGGAYLLTLALTYFCTENRKNMWIKPLETRLAKLNSAVFPPVAALAVVILLSVMPSGLDAKRMLQAGALGIFSYLAINLLSTRLEKAPRRQNKKNRYMLTGFSAFVSFIYLELLDDTFSLESVVGAFSITDQVLLIFIGLGVGAIWVRSMTIYFIRSNTDNRFLHLETGAHYIMLLLAFVAFTNQFTELPHLLIAVTILVIIFLAVTSSPKTPKNTS